MAEDRITVSIKSDTEKLGKLLRTATDDRAVLVRLVKEPLEEFAKAGIQLDKYYKTAQDQKRIAADIDAIVKGIIGGEIQRRLFRIVEETSYSLDRSSSYEYNFDNSSSTDYKYESHTGSSRGTFSDTTRGEATDTNRGFAGIGLAAFGEVMLGPLISEKAVELIKNQFAKTLGFTGGK